MCTCTITIRSKFNALLLVNTDIWYIHFRGHSDRIKEHRTYLRPRHELRAVAYAAYRSNEYECLRNE